jgi:hypothetical protein
VLLHERELVLGEPPELPQLLRHDAGDAAHVGGGRTLPHAGHGVSVVEPGHRVREIAHEILPTQLSVGEDLESELALVREALENRLVLELTDPRLRCRRIAARGQQRGGTQKAADLIGEVRRGHRETSCNRADAGAPGRAGIVMVWGRGRRLRSPPASG